MRDWASAARNDAESGQAFSPGRLWTSRGNGTPNWEVARLCRWRCASSRIGFKGAVAAPFLCVGALLLSPFAFPRIHGVTAQESGGVSDEPSALEALEARWERGKAGST